MRSYFSFTPLFTVLIFLGACGPQTNTATSCETQYQQRGEEIIYRGEKSDDIIIHLTSEPPNLHPTIQSHTNRNIIVNYTHLALASVSIDGGISPELAEDAPEVSADGLSYTYRVKDDAKWEDGRPITAKDVLFSYKIAVYPHTESPEASAYLTFLKDVQIDEKDEQKLTLSMNDTYILNAHLTSNQYILDQNFFDPDHLMDKYTFAELLDQEGAASKDEALITWATEYKSPKYGREIEFLGGGAGPYKIESWDLGQQVTIVRKENYWASDIDDELYAQEPERIIFKFIPDDQSAALQIKQEAIDVSASLSTAAFDDLKESEEANCNYNLYNINRSSVAVILLNNRPDGITHANIFDDVKVRQAFAYSIPIDDIIAEYLNGNATRLNSVISNMHVDYNASLEPTPFDLERSRSLLDEAGWVDSDQDGIRDKVINGKKTDLAFSLSFANTQQALIDISERISLELRKIGVQCTAEPLQGIAPKLIGRDYDAIMTALNVPPAPHDFHQLWHSTGWPNGSNYTGYANPKVDELSDKARVELDPEARRKLTDKIQAIIYADQPMVCLFNPTKKIAVHKRFNNIEVYPTAPYISVNNLEVIRE